MLLVNEQFYHKTAVVVVVVVDTLKSEAASLKTKPGWKEEVKHFLKAKIRQGTENRVSSHQLNPHLELVHLVKWLINIQVYPLETNQHNNRLTSGLMWSVTPLTLRSSFCPDKAWIQLLLCTGQSHEHRTPHPPPGARRTIDISKLGRSCTRAL